MATLIAPITPADFEALDSPDGREYELLDGELIEMPSASGTHNAVAGILTGSLGPWLRGRAFGMVIPDTEFAVGEGRLRPDISIVMLAKWKRIGASSLPLPEPPDIAIEIISPSESAITVDRKVRSYLKAGVQEVWEVLIETESLYIHTVQNVKRLGLDALIETPLIPGWSLAMSDLLRKDGDIYF
jgi:Uma2 family endonuclease